MKKILCAILSLMLLLSATCAFAEGWTPEDEVKVIVAYGAGGSSDLVARIFATQGASAFKTPLVIENMPGGGNAIGFSALIQSAPDGMTIANTNSSVVTNCLPGKEAPYIYYEEMTPICQVGYAPYVVYVKGDSNINNLDDLKNEILSREVLLACNNRGGQTHWEMEYFAMRNGGDVTSVIYGGGADSIAALLGGHVDVTVQAPADGKEYVKSGDLKAIAILDANRLDLEPFTEVPTSAEQGYEWFTNGFFHGYSAPKDIPEDKLQYFEDAFKAALEMPEVAEAISGYGFSINYLDSEGFKAAWLEAVDKYINAFAELGDRLSE